MFTTQQEMDANAKKWLAILIPCVLAFSAIGFVSALASSDEFLINLASLFAGR